MFKELPPLRQSTYETMACPHSYGLIHVQGLKTPDSIASTRGTEVHNVLAKYVEHCAGRRVPADYAYFDVLAEGVGEEASEVLDICRDSFTVDWANLYATEALLKLDRDFQPITGPTDSPDAAIPHYSGTLDTIYILPGEEIARIVDYKSHPRPFEPHTFQAKLYSLMLFMHVPTLKEVEFVLRFVRYPNVANPIKFYRSDVPKLKEAVERVRMRQKDYHQKALEEGVSELPALAGGHCQYCPAITNFTCPIKELNPHTNMSPTERLNVRLWWDVANRVNNQAMAQYVDGSENVIHGQDANGKSYTFGPVEKEKVTYPLFSDNGAGGFDMPVVERLLNWVNEHPEDVMPTARSKESWLCKLRIGATQLKSYLKANKREIVHNAIKDVAKIETVTENRVTRDAEVDDGKGEEHQNFDEMEF